ncbi:hypothetical protein AB0B28_11465 [Glycomyces sp. NPDC046736]|uniref:hypothetical protein n=1 Tax=Glycomyces sp. NPDC046736 TaxID=3155615 RepID=UPI0034042A76
MPATRLAAAAAVLLAGALAACGTDAQDSPDLGGSWQASLDLVPEWKSVYPGGTGTVKVTSADGTSVQLTVAGLGEETEYMAHIHDAECDETPPGGGHWLADPSGEDAVPNIVELHFTTSTSGTGSQTESADVMLDDRAESVVVHAPDDVVAAEGRADNRILCGDLDD